MMPTLYVFTITLNGMPFLPMQFANLNRLPESVDWRWSICEGAAMNLHCTKWCKPQEPGLSNDGTSDFLRSVAKHPRVTVHQRPMWFGKIEMVTECLKDFTRPGIVLEADCDEIWLPSQLVALMDMFARHPNFGSAHFFCRYFLGVNVLITTPDTYGNRPTEWSRCWRWTPTLKAISHEPPIMDGLSGICVSREQTRGLGLVFDHYSWALERNVKDKLKFYGYGERNIEGWHKLQANTQWPCEVRSFLPWVDRGAKADLAWRPST